MRASSVSLSQSKAASQPGEDVQVRVAKKLLKLVHFLILMVQLFSLHERSKPCQDLGNKDLQDCLQNNEVY
jgi:hypothetical protein